MASRGGLSKRELKLQKSVKPVQPVRTSPLLSSKTPLGKLQQAQKSQPIATVNKGATYGPFLPKKTVKPQFQSYKDILPKAGPSLPGLFKIPKKTAPKKTELKFDKLYEKKDEYRPKTEGERKAQEISSSIKNLGIGTKKINYGGNVRDENIKLGQDENINKVFKQSDTGDKTRVRSIFKTAKDIIVPTFGRSQETLDRFRPKLEIENGDSVIRKPQERITLAEKGKGLLRTAGSIANIIPQVGGFAATKIADRFGSESYAEKVRKTFSGYRERSDQILSPKSDAEAAAQQSSDVLSNIIGVGAGSRNAVKNITEYLAQESSSEASKNLLKSYFKNISDEVLDNISIKTANAQTEADVLKVLSEADVPEINQALRGTNEIIEDSQVPIARQSEEEIIDSLPTYDELPTGKYQEADQIFRDIDASGREKIYINVSDGGRGLQKIEIGELDELGNFKENLAEDGRPITEVLDENARNLRGGKKGSLLRSETSGDSRGLLEEFKKKEGLLNKKKKKLTSSSDSKLAKTAEETNVQDAIKSKIERLKEEMKSARSPEAFAKAERQLEEETSILRDYPKLGDEDKRFFKEKYSKEDPTLTDRITEDYQNTRETAFEAPKREKGSLVKAMEAKNFTKGDGGKFTGSTKKDPLLQEAGKYKSAEEFVNGQGDVVYRGGLPFDKKLFNTGELRGLSVTRSAEDAKDFSGKLRPADKYQGGVLSQGKNGVVEQLSIDKNAKVLSVNDAPKELRDYFNKQNRHEGIEKISLWAEKNGYDAVDFKDFEIRILNPDVIKTKSQLTDLYNKAQGGKGILTKAPVYKGESDLTTKILTDLEGRSTVSKQYILDATNRGDIKQAERDLIRRILDDEGPDVDVKKFAEKVKTELLPLKTNNPPSFPGKDRNGNYGQQETRYENINLPDELRGPVENYRENIYESPIATSAGDVHFTSARNPVKNYFAHSRIEDVPGGTRRVIEIQSDLFQKGRLETEISRVRDKGLGLMPDDKRLREVKDDINDVLSKDRIDNTKLQELYKKRDSLQEEIRTGNSESVLEMKKLEPYRNTWHERVIREELKKAAQDGKTKVQFPTGETAMKIEGLGGRESVWFQNINGRQFGLENTDDFTPEFADDWIGMEIFNGTENGSWIITDVLGDGKFKAVPKDKLYSIDTEEELFDTLNDSKHWSLAKNDDVLYKAMDDIFDENVENADELFAKYDYDDLAKRFREQDIKQSANSNVAEQFDISGKVDTENPIYKFYEKTVQKYLNKFGGKVVTDAQGVKWVEVPVSKEMGNKPVTAFANASGAGAGFEEGEDGKIRYNAEKGLLGLGAGMIGMKGAKALSKGGFNSSQYVKQMARQQRNAEGKTTGLLAKTSSFLSEVKKKIIDTNAPIEDLIAQQQKKLNFEAIPRYDITNAIDRVYRSTSMAGAFAKENGLEKVIKQVDDLDEFDQYLIAKHGLSLEKEGIQTGRDAAKDRLLIEAVGDKYAKEEKVVRDYSHKLMDYAVESGLISRKTADDLKAKYPDYVPYNRIFGEDEAVAKGTGGGVASLGSQSVVQKIKGSQREVQSPMRSFLEKTTTAFQQGEKNKTAQILTSYKNLPDNPFGLEKVVGTKNAGDNTISVFKDGEKEIWKVNKDIADAAKALNVEQMGILGKMFAAPVRIAKLGITGINIPFVAANVTRDIVSAFVNSKNPFRSLTAMPQALFEAAGHQKLYKEMMKEGAMQTSFDIARNQVSPTIRNTRGIMGNKGLEKVKYVASTPAQFFRAVEDIIGRSEELNRIAQYKGAYQGAIKKGMTPVDARAVAARASRENSVNFARKGEFGSAMNALVLYLNAGIQGSRTLVRNLKTRPIQTSSKIAATVAMPMAITTAWNLSDPKRKEAYMDLQPYEKENNFILIPSNPTKDEDGKWNVIKIPIQPGLSNLVQPIRYALENANEIDPPSFAQIASQLSGVVSPVQVPYDADSTRKTVGQLTPQAIKPTLEAQTNTVLFTGGKIVPQKLAGLSPELQVKENTSGTSKLIAKQFGASPLQVEQFIKGTFGSVGLQYLNASDRTLAKTGKLSPDEIGGQDVMKAVTARFSKATGGAIENAVWDQKAEASEKEKSEKYIAKQDFMPTYNKVRELSKSSPEEAQALVDQMSDEDYKQYSNIKKAERAKSSTEFKSLLKANAKEAVKHLKKIQESDPEEAERLLNNMDDNEYNLYESGK